MVISTLCIIIVKKHDSFIHGFAQSSTNKSTSNIVTLDSLISQGEVERMIDNSFNLVVSKMTKKDQQSILLHLDLKN